MASRAAAFILSTSTDLSRRTMAVAASTMVAAAGVVVVVGSSLTAPTATAAPTRGPCPDTVTTTGAICTAVTVPQDYSQPDGETIDVTVSRLPARDPGARRGVLFGDADVPEEAMIALNMQSAVMCNENQTPPRPLDYPGFLWTQFVTGDMFDAIGLMFSSGAACAGAGPVTTPVALSGEALDTPPLVITSVGDPQTPLAGAQALAHRMGAHMITVDGGDHGQVAKGNTVVDDAVVEYLRTGHTGITDAPQTPLPVAE